MQIRPISLNTAAVIGGSMQQAPDGSYVLTGGREEISLAFHGTPGAPDGGEGALRYLVLHIMNPQMVSENMSVSFTEQHSEKARIAMHTCLMANMEAQVVFDLQDLDAQHVFLPMYPGVLKRTTWGDSTRIENVDRITITLLRGFDEARRLDIKAAYWTDEKPENTLPKRVNTDALGQWTDKQWPGKATSEAEMAAHLQSEWALCSQRTFPEGWSQYGGQLPPRYEATGYFRVEKRDGRWIMIDPEGCLFFSTGVFGVYPGEPGWILGNEDYLPELPDPKGEFAPAYEQAGNLELYRRKFSGMFPDETLLFSYATANLIKAFGAQWYTKWAQMTAGRLRGWGVNTLSMFSDPEFIRQSKLPYVIMLKHFPVTKQTIFREFPDVFSDEYDQLCREFAAQLEPYQSDPCMIGYFLNNEPTWGFLDNLNLAEKLMESAEKTASRAQLLLFLRERYEEDIERFNAAWQLHLNSFDELEQPMAQACQCSAQAADDLWAFNLVLMRRYAALPSSYTRKVAPHHLNLGMRFGGLRSPALLETCKSFDVFSFNNYSDSPVSMMEMVVKAGIDQPILVGEFHFGALDRGLPHPSLFAVSSQAGRVEAYTRYLSQAAAHPNAVGVHYFAYNDQPLWGRYDGENYQFGFVDVCNRAYDTFTEGVRAINTDIYAVKQSEREPLSGHTQRL